jgi:MATE family multidrug resistance protein
MASAFRRELRELVHLALPIIGGFVGNQLMGVVDNIMVGRLGAAAIGGAGIGGGIYNAVALVAMGCAMGIDPLVSQAVAAGEHGDARRTYWQGVRVALLCSVPLVALLLVSPAILAPLGVEPATAAATTSYLWGRAWNTVPLALFGAARSYVQATGYARAVVVWTVVANLLNFLLDAVLIYGDAALVRVGLPALGLPALGVLGAGIASTTAATLSLVVLWLAIRAIPVPADPERRRLDPARVRRILAIGVPIGLQMLVEVSAFAAASALSGRIGDVAAAGNQVALTLAAMTFMVPLGIGNAGAVRVGLAVGRGDGPGARRAGLAGFLASTIFMSGAALAFLLAPGPLARLITDQPEVVAAALPLIRVAALFQLFDGVQVTAAGALRGAGDTRSTFYANVVGHFIVGLPLAVLLAFPRGLGATGLWWGLSAGLTTVALLLGARFHRLSSRPLARVGTSS